MYTDSRTVTLCTTRLLACQCIPFKGIHSYAREVTSGSPRFTSFISLTLCHLAISPILPWPCILYPNLCITLCVPLFYSPTFPVLRLFVRIHIITARLMPTSMPACLAGIHVYASSNYKCFDVKRNRLPWSSARE
jgi:hypothetical protein